MKAIFGIFLGYSLSGLLKDPSSMIVTAGLQKWPSFQEIMSYTRSFYDVYGVKLGQLVSDICSSKRIAHSEQHVTDIVLLKYSDRIVL